MRIQLEISENRHRQLRHLMEKADFKTYSELFNNAVTLLQWSIQQIEEGCSIVSLRQDSDKQKELSMPFLQQVAYAGARKTELESVRKSTRHR
jgi:Arc/MetJ-type ribon-helix-helix transcriptional regulator